MSRGAQTGYHARQMFDENDSDENENEPTMEERVQRVQDGKLVCLQLVSNSNNHKDSLLSYLEAETDRLEEQDKGNRGINGQERKDSYNEDADSEDKGMDKEDRNNCVDQNSDDEYEVKNNKKNTQKQKLIDSEEEEEEEDEDENNDDDKNELEKLQKTKKISKQLRQNKKQVKQSSSLKMMQPIKDDEDFYFQANLERQKKESKYRVEFNQVQNTVSARQGKILSVNLSLRIYSIACFKQHVFDLNPSYLQDNWCPFCKAILQKAKTYAEEQGGEVESQFLTKEISIRCKYYHRWTFSESGFIKSKQWCPKCPEVYNLMIEHHHKGFQTFEERLCQLKEEAKVIAQGYLSTNKGSLIDLDQLSEIYFLAILEPNIYKKYLMGFEKSMQVGLFNQKYKEINGKQVASHPITKIAINRFLSIFATILPDLKETREYLEEKEKEIA